MGVLSVYFYFLGGGLRVFYNSDICEESRPPLGFKNSQIEIEILFLGFFIVSPNFSYTNSDDSPEGPFRSFWRRIDSVSLAKCIDKVKIRPI